MNYPPPYAPPLPPKKKSGWVNVLLIGCGCLMGLGLAAFAIMALIGYSIFNREDPNDTAIMLDNLNLKGKPAVMYSNAEEITGKLHLDMPKVSVLETLGTPSEYAYAKWDDRVIYMYGDSCTVEIGFDHGVLIDATTYCDGQSTTIIGDETVVDETVVDETALDSI